MTQDDVAGTPATDVPATTPETVVETPVPAEPGTADAGTAEPVAESDEDKAEKLVKADKVRREREGRALKERFRELTSTIKSKDRQLEQLTNVLEGRQQGQQPQRTADADPEPSQDDPKYQDWTTWNRDHVRWVARQETNAVIAEHDRKAQERTQRANLEQQASGIAQQHEQRMREFSAKTPDFETVLDNDAVVFPDAQAQEIAANIAILSNGPEVLYAMGKNPALVQALQGKRGAFLTLTLGQISAAVGNRTPQITNAPPPATPVASRSGPISRDIEGMTRDQYYDHLWKGKR